MEGNQSQHPTQDIIQKSARRWKKFPPFLKKHQIDKGMTKGCLLVLRRAWWLWFIVLSLTCFVALGVSIALAITNSDFRQQVFIPILDSLIASAIISGTALVVVKITRHLENRKEKEPTKGS